MAKTTTSAKTRRKAGPLTDEQAYLQAQSAGAGYLMAAQAKATTKRLHRQAFSGAWQALGPFEVADQAALNDTVSAFVTYLAGVKKPKQWPAAGFDVWKFLLHVAQEVGKGIHTHNGRLVHGDAQARVFFAEAPRLQADGVYFGYAEAVHAGMRGVSATMSHAPVLTDAARIFVAQVQWQGEVTSLAQLLARDCGAARSAFLAAGAPEETVTALVRLLAGVSAATLRHAGLYGRTASELPQMLWPEGDGGYVALSAVPAVAVNNALLQMSANARSKEAFLPSTTFAVGSGQAQNVAIAACDTAGNVALLKCVPPRVGRSRARALVSATFSGRLIARQDPDSLSRFDQVIHPRTNAQRQRFLRGAAFAHASSALAPLLELRDIVQDDPTVAHQLPETLAPEFKTVLAGDVPESPLLDRLVSHVLESGMQPVLLRHTAEDVATYREELRAAVARLVL